jgi:hypothetical protein
MMRVLAAVGLVFLCTSANAQTTPPCTVSEDAIFAEARICGKMRDGSLSKDDLTIAGFTISESSLEDVIRQFPAAQKFRLGRGEEAPVGLCVKEKGGSAVVFASGSSGGWKFLDSIYLGPAVIFEKQGAKCVQGSLPGGASTKSGIRLGMEKNRVLARLRIARIAKPTFEVDYSTSPEKAPWVSEKSRPTDGEGWVAMSGAYGAFRNGRLRWMAVYGGVSG